MKSCKEWIPTSLRPESLGCVSHGADVNRSDGEMVRGAADSMDVKSASEFSCCAIDFALAVQ